MSEVRTVMIGEKKYKLPFFDQIPYDDKQREALRESIREKGVVVPVILWKEESTATTETVVDGANRVLCAAAEGLDKIPSVKRSFASEAEARAEGERLNFDRRHLTRDQLSEQRKARIARIEEARAAGETIRAIAAREGISKSQVGKDADAVHQGTKRAFCDRCKRVGTVQGCHACKIAEREARKRKADAKKKRDAAAPSVLVDPDGRPVPKSRQQAFGDKFLLYMQDKVAELGAELRREKFASAVRQKAKHFHYLDHIAVEDDLVVVSDALDRLVALTQMARPLYVCPKCMGEGCKDCHHDGIVPKWRRDELL
jgi:hypothetical protein